MNPAKIDFLTIFKPLMERGKYRFKVMHGGRGGGKTVHIAIALLLMAMQNRIRILCTREIQKSIKESVHKTLTQIIEEQIEKDFESGILRSKSPWSLWKTTEAKLVFPNGSEFIFMGLSGNLDRIKSTAAIDICWVEEAQTISMSSINFLTPTVRNENAEVWFSFNRTTENDPVWERFCVDPRPDTWILEINWDKNTFFPKVLNIDRLYDKEKLSQSDYEHIWEGKPKSCLEESYYGKYVRKAEDERRISRGVYEPTLKVNTVWDLGVSDATSIWFFQLFGLEIRCVDYYECSGEGLPFYVDMLRKKAEEYGYQYGVHFAPHDIRVRELGTGQSRLEVASKLGIDFNVLSANNIIEGIQQVRYNFHRCYFDAETTQLGLKCLKNYRKEFDEKRQCYKDKPLHDWTSHGADSFRYLHQALPFLSTASGVYKTDEEFDEDYKTQCVITETNKYTKY